MSSLSLVLEVSLFEPVTPRGGRRPTTAAVGIPSHLAMSKQLVPLFAREGLALVMPLRLGCIPPHICIWRVCDYVCHVI